MTDKHPKDCRCEACKRFREREYLRGNFPERERELRHIRGQDSEPDPVLSKIPDGWTEREARAAGYL